MAKTKRTTPLKKAILELFAQHHLLSAVELLEKLHIQGLKVNKTSIYRNLDSFLQDDLLCQHTFGNDSIVYELQKDHHDHVRCSSCGKIQEIPCVTQLPTQIAGFAVDHHHLTLYGLCSACQQLTS